MANQLSGAQWVNAFPTSRSVEALAEPFRTKVKAFLAALASAGASLSISATYRPKERAYLMHYCYLVANGEIAASDVPPMPGVPIQWVHPTNAESVAAAQAMVDGYGIAYPAVLQSRHTQRLAIDMTISWSGDLRIKKPDGSIGLIDSGPRDGSNPTLQHIGSLYGVIKLESDPPHWSSDGH